MSLISKDELKSLAETTDSPRVSIFIPTIQVGAEIQQNRIRLKNMLRQAEEDLISSGLRSVEARDLLEPAQDLLKDEIFWQTQSDGLAVFIGEDQFHYYRLPLQMNEQLVVNHHFYVKPLMPLFTSNGTFYLLALSMNEVRFFQGTPQNLKEIEVEGMPENMDETSPSGTLDDQLHYHTTGGPNTGGTRRDAMFHGQGSIKEDKKDFILQYFREIDRALHPLLVDEKVPLLLAGDVQLPPIYWEANTYPHLLEEGITGNPEDVKIADLHAQALEILQPYFERSQEEATSLFLSRHGQGDARASTDLEEIIPAAYYGRIEHLFVPAEGERWGTFDPDTGEVRFYERATPNSFALFDFAATHTFLHGGSVFTLDGGQIPGGGPVAAVFRYDAGPSKLA